MGDEIWKKIMQEEEENMDRVITEFYQREIDIYECNEDQV